MAKSINFEDAVRKGRRGVNSFYYPISRDSVYIQTKKWIGSEKSPLIQFTSDFTFNQFLDYRGDSEITNWERLQASYITEEEKKSTRAKPLIKRGVKVCLPNFMVNKIDREFDNINKVPRYESTSTFLTETQKQLLNDPYFDQRLSSFKDILKEYFEGEEFWEKMVAEGNLFPRLRTISPKPTISKKAKLFFTKTSCSVWIYSRVLGKLLNVSSKIIKLKTVNKLKGSSFEISLAGVTLSESVESFSIESMSQESLGTSSLSGLYGYQKYFSNNDLVFIKFADIDKDLNNTIEINPSNLSRKFYDMIGLVDIVSEDIDYDSKDVVFEISGRDLSKIFEDDEAKFFPQALSKGLNDRMVLGTNSLGGEKLIKRTFYGEYYTMFSSMGGSVGEIFMWYINLLSNMGILPEKESNYLLSSYGDRRKKRDGVNLQSGVYQIIDTVVDERVKERRLVDQNIGSPDGSLTQLFSNLCISPFVEWFTETYGDMFTIVIRQPPFTQELILQYLNNSGVVARTISNEALSSTNLQFEDQFYTWYQLTPTGQFWSIPEKTTLDYLPVLQLDEYIEIWGSRPMVLETNYFDIDTSVRDTSDQDLAQTHKRAIEDLLLMVETTSYLPFTRKGTITLSHIDRSFRKGTFCYFEKTSEIFYIESVVHSASTSLDSIDGTTTLSVSRGMVLDFIKGVTLNGKLYSYFTIVDRSLMKETLYANYGIEGDTKSLGRNTQFIDSDIFYYFFEKSQFGIE